KEETYDQPLQETHEPTIATNHARIQDSYVLEIKLHYKGKADDFFFAEIMVPVIFRESQRPVPAEWFHLEEDRAQNDIVFMES
ncbi:728_t:CDS:2, partial [Racocetra persica]